jgi:predicted nuclease of predicted toxin-antitoxin system
MKVKLDENLSRYLKGEIEPFGHDVDTVAEEGLLSQPDTNVGAAAKADERMLFTLDLDFSDIRRFPPGTHPGIVVFRPISFGTNEVNRFVTNFVSNSDLSSIAGCLVVVEPNRIRVRRSVDNATESSDESAT